MLVSVMLWKSFIATETGRTFYSLLQSGLGCSEIVLPKSFVSEHFLGDREDIVAQQRRKDKALNKQLIKLSKLLLWLFCRGVWIKHFSSQVQSEWKVLLPQSVGITVFSIFPLISLYIIKVNGVRWYVSIKL